MNHGDFIPRSTGYRGTIGTAALFDFLNSPGIFSGECAVETEDAPGSGKRISGSNPDPRTLQIVKAVPAWPRRHRRVAALTLAIALAGISLGGCRSGTTPFEAFSTEGVQRKGLTRFDPALIAGHSQIYQMSCIPSSVEMVLKLEGRVPESYHELQTAWKNKRDGSFANFHGKTIAGVTFHQQFTMARNAEFPLEELFATIQDELAAGRYVIVCLPVGPGCHNFLIYDEDVGGEFLAVSKAGATTIEERHVKAILLKMQGADIGTYKLDDSGAHRS